MRPLPKNPRARDLGLSFQGLTGHNNAITDVPEVEVGFTTLNSGEGTLTVGEGPVRTGVTIIHPRGRRKITCPTWAGRFCFNGNGEMTGTNWIDDAGYFYGPIGLTNTHSVGMVHHAIVGWLIQEHENFFQKNHAWAMPVVAETYDGYTNDICGQHVTGDHVLAALKNAGRGPVPEGNVGGGTGMMTYEFKGGTGTSSRVVVTGEKKYTIGALVQSNFGKRKDLTILGVPIGKHMTENAIISEVTGRETGSIIVVIGTDLPLLPIQLQRIARRATMGIARTGSPGGHYSGDIFLAFSVANKIELSGIGGLQSRAYSLEFINDHYFDDIYDAAVQSVEEAIINAMVAAESMTTIKPAGKTVEAIDHNRLKALMRRYNRLKE